MPAATLAAPTPPKTYRLVWEHPQALRWPGEVLFTVESTTNLLDWVKGGETFDLEWRLPPETAPMKFWRVGARWFP